MCIKLEACWSDRISGIISLIKASPNLRCQLKLTWKHKIDLWTHMQGR